MKWKVFEEEIMFVMKHDFRNWTICLSQKVKYSNAQTFNVFLVPAIFNRMRIINIASSIEGDDGDTLDVMSVARSSPTCFLKRNIVHKFTILGRKELQYMSRETSRQVKSCSETMVQNTNFIEHALSSIIRDSRCKINSMILGLLLRPFRFGLVSSL